MSWLLFAFLGTFLIAIAQVVDKYVITNWADPKVPMMIFGPLSLIASSIIYFSIGFSSLMPLYILFAISGGIIKFSGIMVYFKALQYEEISRIVPFQRITPIYVVILAFFFLNEVLSLMSYLGIVLVIIGAFLISIKDKIELKLSKGFRLILLSSFLLAVGAVMLKFILGFTDYWTAFAYFRMGSFFASLPLIYFNSDLIVNTFKQHGQKSIFVITGNEAMAAVAHLFIAVATSLGAVSLVNSINAIRPFLVLSFSLILSFNHPHILKEKFDRRTIILKVVSTILVVIGLILIVR